LNGNVFTFDGTNSTETAGGGKIYTLQTMADSLVLNVTAVATPEPAYWGGAQGDGSWATISGTSNLTNWLTAATGGTDTHQIPGGLSDVFFTANSATNLSTTLDGNFTINSLTFTGTGTAAGTTSVTIASGGLGTNALTIAASSGTGITVNSGAAADTISANVILAGDQSWTNNSTSTFTVSGAVSSPTNNNLTVAGSGDTTISGNIGTGSGALTMAGTGNLILSGANNTYSGNTTVNSGTLYLAAASTNNVASSAAIGIAAGAAVDVTGLTASTIALAPGQAISGTGSGISTVNGTVAMGGSNTLSAGTGNTLATGGITADGSGNTITGPGTVSGNATVHSGGSLAVAASATLNGTAAVNGGGKLVVAGSISGSVNVASGGTLASGNNIFAQIASLNVNDPVGGGTVAPGDTGGSALTSIGQLNVAGGVALGTAAEPVAHLSIELGGTTAGVSYDTIAMSGGALNLANVDLDGSLINSFLPAKSTFTGGTLNLDGATFYIVTGAGSVTGTFANQAAPSSNLPGYNTIVFGGQEFAISYSASFSGGNFAAGSGYDVALMAIPEPNSLSMLAGSFCMALGLQRFRRRRKSSTNN
jgi:autotransporter-associated beta strand protein